MDNKTKQAEQELGEGDAVIQESTQAEGQEASPEKERKLDEETEHSFSNAPADFDKEEICVDGGKIDKILEQLYEACKEENIPCLAFVNYGLKEKSDSQEIAVRGLQVSIDGWMPPIFKAVMAVTENQELMDLISRITRDPMILMFMKMMSAERAK